MVLGTAIGRWLWVAVLVLLPLGYLVECSYKPQLLMNETTRYLYQFRDLDVRHKGPSLVPGLFRGDEAKADVQAQLLGAGLKILNVAGDALPAGVSSSQTFHLSAGVRALVCGSELFVTIGFDESDHLVSATIQQGGACL